MLPSNILVDSESWRVTGVVDWAEAEWLPFGVGLYGIEHLLGYISAPLGQREKTVDVSRSGVHFKYYKQADRLRKVFWRELGRRVPLIEENEMVEAVRLARNVGVLLWHGFAWDEGKLDRVVNTVDDGEEVAFLEAMLDTSTMEVSKVGYRKCL
jgi:hypothetical protein